MPNIERIKQLRADLAALPDPEHQFYMGFFFCKYVSLGVLYPGDGYFTASGAGREFDRMQIQSADCGTAACIAGWTCLFNKLPASQGNASIVAQSYLELSQADSDRLFWRVSHEPKLPEALRRLDHLILTGSMKGYDWEGEPGYKEHCPGDDRLLDSIDYE